MHSGVLTAQKAACHPEPRSCCAAILYFMRRWAAISTDMVSRLIYSLWCQHADLIQAGLQNLLQAFNDAYIMHKLAHMTGVF